MRFGRGEGSRTSKESGLTGSPEIPDPPPEHPRDLRGRWRSITQSATGTVAGLPRVIRLVWQTSPGLTAGLAVATAVSGITPAATAYTAKLLINAVVGAIAIRLRGQPDVTSLAVPLPL